MTCIIGVINNGRVFIGGDSIGVGGWDKSIRNDKKVFKKEEMIFGFTSSYRMGQLLRYGLKIPKIKKDQDVFHYMVTDFVDAVRNTFKDGGYLKTTNVTEEEGGTFLVGFKGRLFKIDGDFQVEERREYFNSCGCGESYALGAYSILQDMDITVEEKIIKALEVAEKHSAGVGGPFYIANN